LEHPLIVKKTIYLEENKGIVLAADLIRQFKENSWLAEVFGAEEAEFVDEHGKKHRAMAINPENVNPTYDPETQTPEEAYLNKLYQEEFLQYHSMLYAPKESPVFKGKTKSNSSDGPQLAASAWCTGQINNSEGGVDDLYVIAWNNAGGEDEQVGTGRTSSSGAYIFWITTDNIDSLWIQSYTYNSKGEEVLASAGEGYNACYSVKDHSYQIVGGVYYFGTQSFDVGAYDKASKAHDNLIFTRTKTKNSGGYDTPQLAYLKYPAIGCCGEGANGCYNREAEIIFIQDTLFAMNLGTVSHEFGHHVDNKKTVGIWGGSYESLYGCDEETEGTAFKEGWAQGFKYWITSGTFENQGCPEDSSLGIIRLVAQAIYDLYDNGDDGETCRLYMSEILSGGMISGIDKVKAFIESLKVAYPNDADDITDVKELNHLFGGGWLLASASSEPEIPQKTIKTELFQNHPNPFNPSTSIEFKLGGKENQMVSLEIFDIRGRKICELVSGIRMPGRNTVYWDGKDSKGRKITSGIYFYRLVVGDYITTRKMVLLK